MHFFVSHNHRDKGFVRKLSAQLRLTGNDVWLDEWEVQPGDSIPGKVNDALGAVDVALVIWSCHAEGSRWVGAEIDTALSRHLHDGSVRIVPIRLDDTELPPLLRPLMWLSSDSEDVNSMVRRLTGLDDPTAYRKAIQQTLEDSDLDAQYFHGFGMAVACSRCGAPSSELEQWNATDYARDDQYAGVRCTRCGWEEGGEV